MAPKPPCAICDGSGRLPQYKHIDSGICYDCRGTGRETRQRAGRGQLSPLSPKTAEELAAEAVLEARLDHENLLAVGAWLTQWDRRRWKHTRDDEPDMEWLARAMYRVHSPERRERAMARLIHRLPKELRAKFVREYDDLVEWDTEARNR